MKQYPKIPKHDKQSVLPDDFFEMDTLHVTEKVDGGNLRWMLYDERYADEMPSSVKEHTPNDGDILVGTKRSIKGTVAQDLSEFPYGLHNAVRYLRDNADVEAMRSIHDRYGPVTYFGENMAFHTLEGYDFESSPSVIGFDICVHRQTDSLEVPHNPYEQEFVGFLGVDELTDAFREVGVHSVFEADTVHTVEGGIDPETFEIPQSQFASEMTAEGVVVRSGDGRHRAKIVREDFEELNKYSWGWSESQAENGTELFVARYCSTARVEKQINRMINEEGRDVSMELIEDLRHRVIEDVWKEEWRHIKDEDIEFNPAAAKQLITKICRGAVKRRVKNAELNDADPRQDLY